MKKPMKIKMKSVNYQTCEAFQFFIKMFPKTAYSGSLHIEPRYVFVNSQYPFPDLTLCTPTRQN